MLHITHPSSNAHKKALVAEIGLGIVMFAVFFTSASQASDITVDAIINLVNKARVVANVAALKKNDMLQKAAEKKAQDMIDNNYFAHVSPQGKSPWHWISKSGYEYQYAGENLAINFTNAEDEQEAWMNSPLHRKNILNPNYDEIGVAVKQGVVDGHETTVVVQMFGAQMEKAIASGNIFDDKKMPNETNVAGAEADGIKNISSMQKFSDKMKEGVFFKDNSLTLIGWFSLFALAIMLVIIDVAAVIHKKHKPLFMFHGTKTHGV